MAINYINNGSCGAFSSNQNSDLTQSDLFIDNSQSPFPIYSEFDGFTKTLYAQQGGLQAGSYQLKLAIADVGDAAYDSGVFFGAMQATTGGVAISCDCYSNPLSDPNGDCDQDGILNQDESSPEAALNPCDPNPLAVPDGDCDGDGVINENELSIAEALDPCLPNPSGLSLGDCDGDGIPNGEDLCINTPGVAPSGCPDFDEDGVPDINDLDDDNDGILDKLENGCTVEFNLEDLSFSGGSVIQTLNSGSISTTNNAYASTYSDQTVNAPIHLEFNISTAGNGMIGLLPEGGNQTPNTWNDGAFKWYNYFGAAYGKFNALWNPSAIGINSNSLVSIDIDQNGVLTASIDGNSYVTFNTGSTSFNLALTAGTQSETYSNIILTGSSECSDFLDTDVDGMSNHLDIDSDGDGCFDAIESGADPSMVDSNGQIIGEVDSNGVPIQVNGGLTVNLITYNSDIQPENCCISAALNDCDGDGFTNQEELDGICGFIGDPLDINSPFALQSTTSSGTTDDIIFRLAEQTSNSELREGRDKHLTIKSGHSLQLNANISVRDLVLEDSAELDLNGFTLYISGELTLNGDLTHNLGHLYMRDDCKTRNIYGNKTHDIHELTIQNIHGVTLRTDINVSGPIHPEEGIFNLNDENVILTSYPIDGVIKTGSISEIKLNADVIGRITLHRFVESPEDGYRLVGPPIKNQSIDDISDDLVTTGFEGSDYPNHWFTNIKYYEETNRPSGAMMEGFLDVNSTNEDLKEYNGYWAYFPPSSGSTTLDVSGEFYKREVTIPVTYTPSPDHDNEASCGADGWHCIINPYPSAIDLDSPCIEFHNVGSAIYILDHTAGGTWQGEYAVYNNGVSVNGGDNVVASYQAFMVQATGPGAYIRFNECAKTDEQGIFFRSALQKDLIKLAITQNENAFESVIAFDQNASALFDKKLDARKITAEMFSLFSVIDQDTLAINTLPLDFNGEVPLLVSSPNAGQFSLKVKDVFNGDNSTCFTITDIETNETWRIEPGLEIPFSVDQNHYENIRFVLNKTPIGQLSTAEPECANNSLGSAEFSLNAGEHSVFKWFNSSNQLILEESGTFSRNDALEPGNYALTINSSAGVCSSASIPFTISSVENQVVYVSSTPDTCSDQNGNIKVSVQHAENWSVTLFEDYQVIATESSPHTIEFNQLHGGTYTAVIQTNCIYEEFTVDITDPNEVKANFQAPSEVLIEHLNSEIEVEALSENEDENHWYLDQNYLGENDVMSISFNEIGQYVLTLNSKNAKCEDTHDQEIFVSNATSIEENLEKDFLIIDRSNSIEINNINGVTEALMVRVYDSSGKLIYSNSWRGSDTIIVDKSNFTKGLYFLEISNDSQVLMQKKVIK